MNRFLQTILLACTMTALHAQFVYSTVWTDFSPTYTLTSGISAKNAPGFLWSGYQPQINPGGFPWSPQNLNIFVRGFGPASIWTGYKIYEGNAGNCAGSLTQIMDGVGVSMVEVNKMGTSTVVQYAFAGAYSNGCYFIGIDKFGNPLVNTLFPFPSNNTLPTIAPTKPVLVQDDKSTDFYMTGSCNGQLYVNRVDLAGNLVWSNFYNLPGQAEPKDIVLYPNGGGRVLIAGKVNMSFGDDEGFLLDLDGNNGTVNKLKVFGNPGQNDGFNSILIATAGAGGKDEILLGGFTENTPTTTESWLVKVDQNLNQVWSLLMQPVSGTNFGIVDMMERYNTSFNYEYFILLRSASGMVVLKFDANFNPFVGQFLTMNEYVYNLAGAGNSQAACMSQVNGAPTLMGMGIQVYGTANNITTANTSHMVQAYYNGETNCGRVLTLQNNPIAYKNNDITLASFPYSGLSTCSNFTTNVFYTGGAINFPCTGFIGNGNNARTMATAVEETLNDNVEFQVMPNPASSNATVTFNAEEGKAVKICLLDISGREVTSTAFESDYTGNYSHSFDLQSLQLAAGVYFVDLKIGNNSRRSKLIVNN